MPHEAEKVLCEARSARKTEQAAHDALAAQVDQLLEQLEEANQRLDSAAELLGECMAVVPADLQDTISEEVSAWPRDVVRHFNEAERGARAAETSGANAKLRRAS